MKKITTLITKTILGLCFLASAFTMQAQVLDLESTTEGALLPRMTTAQRTAIVTPNQSEMVYDTETKSFWYWEDMQWNELAAGGELPGNFYEEGSDSPGTAIPDADLAGITSTISLTEAGVIDAETEVRVCLNITHTYTGDLDITLTAPDGTTIMNLTTDNGGSGNNFTNTCFSDQSMVAIESIVAADAPFTGLYRPETNFNALVGQSTAGDWILTVVDDAGGDIGTLDSWSIEITVLDPLVANILSDADGDTKIQVEESVDEDMIRFDIGGTEGLTLKKAANNDFIIDLAASSTMIGRDVGENYTAGSYNLFVGAFSANNFTSGFSNVFIGAESGKNKTTGNDNLFLGADSGKNNTSGDNNVMVGRESGQDNNGSNNVFLGYRAGRNLTGSDKLSISNLNSTTPLIYGEFNTNRVAIGGTALATGYELSVNGQIACEEVLVELKGSWPDYVFKPDYNLKTIEEVASHIQEKGHLPGVPSAAQVESQGIQVGEMNKILMEKVEELTLYIIDLEKRFKALEAGQ